MHAKTSRGSSRREGYMKDGQKNQRIPSPQRSRSKHTISNKPHTTNTQNSIKKPKTHRYPSLKGVDSKFRRNHRHALHGTMKALVCVDNPLRILHPTSLFFRTGFTSPYFFGVLTNSYRRRPRRASALLFKCPQYHILIAPEI